MPNATVEPLRHQAPIAIVLQHELLHIPPPAVLAQEFLPEEHVLVDEPHQHGVSAQRPQQASTQGKQEPVEIVVPESAIGIHRLAAAFQVGQRKEIPDAMIGVPEFAGLFEKLVLNAKAPKPLEPHDATRIRTVARNLAAEESTERIHGVAPHPQLAPAFSRVGTRRQRLAEALNAPKPVIHLPGQVGVVAIITAKNGGAIYLRLRLDRAKAQLRQPLHVPAKMPRRKII